MDRAHFSRRVLPALALVVAAGIVASCMDTRAPLGPADPRVDHGFVNGLPADCTADAAPIYTALDAAFPARGPDYNSLKGKIDNMVSHCTKGNLSQFVAQAANSIAFITNKSPLPGGLAATEALKLAIAHYALDDGIAPGTEVVGFSGPNANPQDYLGQNGCFAIEVPGGTLLADVVLTILQQTGGLGGFDGFSDLYTIKGFSSLTDFVSENGGIGIIVSATAPGSIFSQLKLAKKDDGGNYSLTDPYHPVVHSTLNCQPAGAGASGGASAFSADNGTVLADNGFGVEEGVVSGSTRRFSDFEAILPDTEGAVSGSRSRFSPATEGAYFDFTVSETSCPSAGDLVPPGTILSPDCQQFQLNTWFYKELLAGWPTTFTVTPQTGIGGIAPVTEGGECPADVGSAYAKAPQHILTTADGQSSVCWKIQSGPNSLTWTPGPWDGFDEPGPWTIADFVPSSLTLSVTGGWTYDTLCALTRALMNDPRTAERGCSQLKTAAECVTKKDRDKCVDNAIAAFINLVNGQRGKSISSTDADYLIAAALEWGASLKSP